MPRARPNRNATSAALTGALALWLSLLALAPAAAQEAVDLELVFAVDVSRSMDYDEQVLQREGYADALTHPATIAAILSGPRGRIAIAYLEWGGPWSLRTVLDWTTIASRADALKAAETLRAAPIESSSGTSISSGLARAAEMIETNGFEGTRRVIDVSGDGPNNTGQRVDRIRDTLVGRGIEINGLPLMLKQTIGFFNIPDLDIYYEDCVIGGPAAFVIPVRSRDEFRSAIRLKMVAEISGRLPHPRLRRAAAMDCGIGERLRRQWLDIQGG
ncbi:MAG: DUF1194 domain-containing protein [Alphaproteobacteria bacterium]|nr:MAG: DUF1194 domain-containing protein [Alphaproteobacteria bacterium]